MIKRVKLDKDGWPTEIDWKATRRVAQELKEYIDNAPKSEVMKYEYNERVMPLVNKTLNGTIKIPYNSFESPYNIRLIMDGLYPKLETNFHNLYAEFMCRIIPDIGIMSLSYHETGVYDFRKYRKKDNNGDVYEMCWFED